MYKLKNGGIVSRPSRVGNTFIGTKTDLGQYGYYEVVPNHPNDAPEGQYYKDSGDGVYDESEMTYEPDWVLEESPIKQEPNYGTKMTRLKFEQRFTDAEWIAVDLASIGDTVEAAAIRRIMRLVSQAEFIDMNDDVVRGGVNTLVQLVPSFTQTRADQIINDPVTFKESYNND
jgi:hypothetical protein